MVATDPCGGGVGGSGGGGGDDGAAPSITTPPLLTPLCGAAMTDGDCHMFVAGL